MSGRLSGVIGKLEGLSRFMKESDADFKKKLEMFWNT